MVNFTRKNDGRWFYFNNDEAMGGVCLRELSVEEGKRIEKDTTVVKKKIRQGQMVEYTEIDQEKSFRLTMQYCIVDWKEVAVDGEALECNAMGKEKALKCLDFVKYVSECLNILTDENRSLNAAKEEQKAKEEEDRLKNLKNTSTGK